jgi:lysophospholipase L1-like esterase
VLTPSMRGGLAARVSRPTALLLAPVLLRQGARVRERTPVLPEAAGDRSGRAGAAEGAPLRLLIVGESTAAGVGVAHQRDGIAARLAADIARRHGRAVTWAVSARTGATARATERELVRTVAGDQDLVVVILGVNDTVRLHSRRHWRGQLTRILDVLQPRLAAGGQIVLAGVPDLGAFPALPQPLRAVLGRHARALDDELRRLASRRSGVVHVPSPELTDEAFAEDGFHPDADAYARWAHHLADSVAPGSTAPFRR